MSNSFWWLPNVPMPVAESVHDSSQCLTSAIFLPEFFFPEMYNVY